MIGLHLKTKGILKVKTPEEKNGWWIKTKISLTCFPHRARQKRTGSRTGTGKEWNNGWLYNGSLLEKHSGAAFFSDIQNMGSHES